MTPLLVIGIGNPWRGDDAAGRQVVRHLRKTGVDPRLLHEHSGEGASLLELWAGAADVIVIDAIHSGAAPGSIHRFDASQTLPARLLDTSSHALGLAQAVELARALGRLPRRLVIYGIEAESFGGGAELSAAVRHAVLRVAGELAERLVPQKETPAPGSPGSGV